MKIVSRILVLLVLAIAVLMFFSNRLIADYAIKTVAESTGFKVSVGELDIGILRPVVHIENLTFTNPPDFPYPDAFTVREFYVRYSRLSLLFGNIHLKELRLDIPRVVMVRPEHGDSNLEILAKMGKKPKTDSKPEEGSQGSGGSTTPPESPEKKDTEKSPRGIQIDEMNIRLGEMEVRRYRRNQEEPSVINIPVDLDRSYQNVTNLETITYQLTTELLVRSGVGLLRKYEPAKDGVDKGAKKVADQLNKALNKLNSQLNK